MMHWRSREAVIDGEGRNVTEWGAMVPHAPMPNAANRLIFGATIEEDE
jgi:hypothetical protein